MTCSDRVHDALARALTAHGYHILTPVQRAVLEVAPRSRDMLVSAQTGSGKTLAFGLALAERLLGEDGRARAAGAPRAAVVTPTRELARQVQGELAWLYAETGARILCCTGGVDPRAERAALREGCDVVVGSPGRLRDHIARCALDMSRVGCVVLDEADEMLDLGFREDLEFILDAAPPDRQTLMFSATISRRIEDLAARFQTDPARVVAAGLGGAAADIRFEAVAVAPEERDRAIINILRFHEASAAIVFCARREAVAQLAGRLQARGFKVAALSGALAQSERSAAMAAMRDGRARVCVATDLAARGLDLPKLELVVHADLPVSDAALIHRSGRTGRGGRKGLAVLVTPHAQRRRAEALALRVGVALHWTQAPCPGAIRARDETRILASEALRQDASDEERARAARLLAACGPERIALAFLRDYAGARPAPEPMEPSSLGARPRLRDAVWFSLATSRGAKPEVRWLLPLICRLGGVEGADIGRIVVIARGARFEISARVAAAFESAVTGACAAGVEIRRAPEPGSLGAVL